MRSIILRSYTLELCWASNSVRLHCKNRTSNPNFILCKECLDDHTHMCNTTICYNLFLINLALCCLRSINYTNQTKSTHSWPEIRTPFRKQKLVKALQSISSLLEQDSGLLHTTCSTPFNMCFRQPQVLWHKWNFHCKRQKETPPLQQLSTGMNWETSQLLVVCCSCPTIQQEQTREHCLRPYKSIQYQQKRSTHLSLTTSTLSNQLKHWQLSTLIKHIKTKQIQACKAPKLKTFKCLLLRIKRLTVLFLCMPTAQYCQWHLCCSLLNHPKTQSIQPKFELNCELSIPASLQTNNLLKRFYCYWYKTRPLTHAQNQSYQSKKQRKNTMCFTFLSRLYTQKNSSSDWLLQHGC